MTIRAFARKIRTSITARGCRDAANRFTYLDYATASGNRPLNSCISATTTHQRVLFSSSSKTNTPGEKDKNATTIEENHQQTPMDEDESHLNWKDRKEAPKWMRRIAPAKGGKWPPSPQEAAILAAGISVFVWSCVAGS